MKKYLSIFVVLLLAFVTNVNILKAEDGSSDSTPVAGNTTTTKPSDDRLTPAQKAERERIREEARKKLEENRKDIKETRGEIKDLREGFKEDTKEKREEIKNTREEMKNIARTMVANSLLKRAENLTQISTRIKARIEKLKTNGVDTASASALIIQADTSIALAKTNAQKVKDGITNGDTLETIKANVKATKDALKQAHNYMEQAVKDLKSKAGDKIKTKVETNTSGETN